MCEMKKKNSMPNRLFWIDAVKAICMICVYLVHSRVYYGGSGIDYGYIVLPFYVNAFFFVSGYLFFRKYMMDFNILRNYKLEAYKKALNNTLFRLIIPALLFSTFIYLPKMLFHSKELKVNNFFFDVFGGISFWFTSALAVAQVVLLTLFLTRKRTIGFYVGSTFILFLIGLFLNFQRVSTDSETFFPWFYKTGLVYTFIISLGGLYQQYEDKINKWSRMYLPILFLGYILIIGFNWKTHAINVFGLSGICNFWGICVTICGVALIVAVAKKIHESDWLVFIGRNSIILYFFSGVLPALWASIIKRVVVSDYYGMAVVIMLLSMISGYCITWGIVRYLPFLIDLRKIKNK